VRGEEKTGAVDKNKQVADSETILKQLSKILYLLSPLTPHSQKNVATPTRSFRVDNCELSQA
jgi:hypothetical protein